MPDTTNTLATTETPPLVWIRAQIPKPLRAAISKVQNQSVIDNAELTFDEALIKVLELGFSVKQD